MPSGPSPAVTPPEGTRAAPSPGQPTQPTRRLIRLSSPERQRLSSLQLTPEPELEPPPKPPRSCAALARQALEGSFVGWGMPVQSPQGTCLAQVRWVVPGLRKGVLGDGKGGTGPRPRLPLCSVLVATEEEQEQSASSSEEEEEEAAGETTALGSDMEQVRGRTWPPARGGQHPSSSPAPIQRQGREGSPTPDWPAPAVGSGDLGQELRHHEQVPNVATDSAAPG